jgi:hypothetical protein
MRGLVVTALAILATAGCGGPAAPRTSAPAATAKAAPPKAEPSGPSRVGDLFEKAFKGGDPAAVDEAFRALRAGATPSELPFVDRTIALAAEMRAAGDDVDALVRAATRALADLEKLAPDDATRLAVGQQIYALAVMAAGTPPGAETDALTLAMSERLVAKQPKEPRAHALRSLALRRIQGDLQGALREARICGKSHPPCVELAWALVREIEAPRCKASDLRPGFALHRGTPIARHDKAPRETAVGTTKLWIAEAPSLAAADLVEVVGGDGALLLALAPASRPKLGEYLSQAAFVDAAGVVMADGKAVGAASRLIPMVPDKLLLGGDPNAPLTLEAVCKNVTRNRAAD